jgi:cytochrome c-type biogenesis protein
MAQNTVRKVDVLLWALAAVAVFAVVVLVGTKVFYGLVVPRIEVARALGTAVLLGFSFGAGLAAFFAPCPFAVFPAYIATYLNAGSGGGAVRPRWLHPLRIGVTVSLGIFSFYALLGVLMSLIGTTVASYTNILKLAIIPLFFVLGVLLLRGKSFGTGVLDSMANAVAQRARGGTRFWNMYLYGIVYGIAAAACHLPILLALSLAPILAGKFLSGVLTFLAYAVGASSLLILFTILTEYGKSFMVRNLGLYGERVKMVGGVVLILTSVYLGGFYVIFGM